jgi:hypothetical protein
MTSPVTGTVLRSDRGNVDSNYVDLFASDEVVPFDIPATPFTVMLLRELDWGDQQELEAAALRGLQRQDLEAAIAGNSTLLLDISRQRFLTLALRIKKWNVQRRDLTTGELKPVRLPDHIQERIMVMKKLRPKWARSILGKIEELDRENNEAEPEMPALVAPSIEDDREPPKVTLNGAIDAQSVTSGSANSWVGATQT